MIKQIIILFISAYIILCNKCQSQTIYRRECHSSYTKYFELDDELGFIYSISDDLDVLSWDKNAIENVFRYKSDSKLIHLSIYNYTLYIVGAKGDLFLYDVISGKLKEKYQIINSISFINEKVLFDKKNENLIFYDEQINVSVYSLKERKKKDLNKKLVENIKIVDIFQIHEKECIILLENSSYLTFNLEDIENAKLYLREKSINVQSSFIQDKNTLLIISKEQYIFSIDILNNKQTELDFHINSQIEKVLYLKDDKRFFILNSDNQIITFTLTEQDKKIFQITYDLINNNQNIIDFQKVKKYNQSMYILSTLFGFFIQIDINENSIEYINTQTYYEVTHFIVIGNFLYYSLKGESQGIVQYSLTNKDIVNDMRCFKPAINYDLANPLQFIQEKDEIMLSHHDRIVNINMNSDQIQSKQKALSQKNYIQLRSYVYPEYDLIIIFDFYYVNLLSYYARDIIKSASILNSNENQVKVYENKDLKQLVILGSGKGSKHLLKVNFI